MLCQHGPHGNIATLGCSMHPIQNTFLFLGLHKRTIHASNPENLLVFKALCGANQEQNAGTIQVSNPEHLLVLKAPSGANPGAGPMRGLETDNVISGPMRGFKTKPMGKGQHTTYNIHTYTPFKDHILFSLQFNQGNDC